jgi:hypothetical protein
MKYLLVLIPIFFFSLLYLPVKFEIKYTYSSDNSRLNISTSYLFGLFKPELYPFDKNKRENNKFNTLNSIKPIIKDSQYRRLIDYIWDKSIFENISWNTKIGLTDAFLVSIIYGILWNFKSIIVSFILTNKKIDNIDIDVTPIFNENQLDISFVCIIKIKMVYIITVWIRSLKLYKGGEENDRASNRRVNENYNG